jgi:hypothetical protein
MRESNERIIRLNKRLGFKPIKLRPHYYNNPDETAIVMELQISDRPDPGGARGPKTEAFARGTEKLL